MNKRLFTLLLLVLLLALPLAASGQDMVSAPGEFPIVEEPITLEILMLGHAIVEEFPTNTFTQWYSERTGINLDFNIAPPNEDREVLNLTIASGDLPDIIVGFTVDPSTLALFGPQGLFLPLSGLIEEHGHFINEVFEGSPQVLPLITSPDGEIYGLPQVNECYHCFYAQRAWINQDWLDNVGMSVPQTTDELFDVLTAFKEQDANGNGDPNDEVPLAGAATGWNTNIDGFLMNPFVAAEFKGNNQFFEMNGGVISQHVTSEGYREGLRYLHKLFAAGLFGEESFTQPVDQVKQQVEGGDASSDRCSSRWRAFQLCQYRRRPLATAIRSDSIALEGPMGVRQVHRSTLGVSARGSVSSTPRPSILRPPSNGVMACMIAKPRLRSVFGVPRCGKLKRREKTGQWRWAEEGEPALGPEFESIWRRLSTFGTLQNVHWAQRGPSYRPNHLRLGEVRRDDAGGLEVVLYEQTKANYEPYARDIADVIPPLAFTTAQAAEVTELRLGIIDYVAQMTAEFVLGRQDLDAGWDNFVATLDALGINRVAEIYQSAYDAQYGG